MFNFVQRRKWYFLFSGFLILISLVAMGISVVTYPEHTPIRLSIDFLGGSLFEVQFKPVPGSPVTDEMTESRLVAIFSEFGAAEPRVQRLGNVTSGGDSRWQVRTGFLDNETTAKVTEALDALAKSLGLQFDRDGLRINQMAPSVGSEVTRAAVVAVIVASIVVIGFIAVAFRQVANSFRYGMCAVLAMIHDVIVLVGAMSILGLLFGWEADSLFLTALLTIVAYSVQDAIVVFDRIRENSTRRRGEPYEMIVNRSIMETLLRSITTQVLIAFILFSLMLMGGNTIRPFVTVLLIGLISGTYSSLFIGIPLLVAWENGDLPLLSHRRVAFEQ